MSAGQCVGRVGGLAVALGIGAAVLVGAQTASADDGSGAASGSSPHSSSDSHPARAASAVAVSARARPSQSVGAVASPDRQGALGKPKYSGGSAESPMNWVEAAAARREIETAAAPAPAAASPEASVARAVAGTGVSVISSVTRIGQAPTSPALTPDGTRAVTVISSRNLFTGFVTRVAVIDTATGKQVGKPISVSGAPRYYNYSPLVSADGSRAIITTAKTNGLTGLSTTQVTVIDTATGNRVGSTVTLSGNQPSAPVMNDAGTRAVITTTSDDGHTSATTTRVSVIDMTSGAQIGSTVSLVGSPTTYPTTSPVFNTDGTRALVVTNGYDQGPGTNTTQVAVIDTTTGVQAGNTITLTSPYPISPGVTSAGDYALINTTPYGFPTQVTIVNTDTGAQTGALNADASVLLNSNGTRVVVTKSVSDETTGAVTTEVSLIDTATGNQVGPTLNFDGSSTGSPVLNAAGTRAVYATSVDDQLGDTIGVAVVDTTTGTQVGTTLNLAASNPTSTVSTVAGSRAVITAAGYGPDAGTTLVSVIDTATGTHIGTTVGLAGSLTGAPVLDAGGTRAVIITDGSQVSVIDMATGTQVGSPVVIAGDSTVSTQVSADGTRALITTGSAFTQPRISVIDLDNSTQLGATLIIGGTPSGPATFIADDTRALIATDYYDSAAHTHTKTVALINTSTGDRVGPTFTITSAALSSQVMSADGTRVVLTTTSGNLVNGSTLVTVIDTIAGTKSTTTVSGYQSTQTMVTADGNRAVMTAQAFIATRVAVLQI